MEWWYELFVYLGVRDIGCFNELMVDYKIGEKFFYFVVVIDEFVDLMMVVLNDVEESIVRIVQKVRVCGIYLFVVIQCLFVDVIIGMIKVNILMRIVFFVLSQVDFRMIIDMVGVEKFFGKGDMFYWENGIGKLVCLQGNFVFDREIDCVVFYVRKQLLFFYLFEQEELIRQGIVFKEEDELFFEVC